MESMYLYYIIMDFFFIPFIIHISNHNHPLFGPWSSIYLPISQWHITLLAWKSNPIVSFIVHGDCGALRWRLWYGSGQGEGYVRKSASPSLTLSLLTSTIYTFHLVKIINHYDVFRFPSFFFIFFTCSPSICLCSCVQANIRFRIWHKNMTHKNEYTFCGIKKLWVK